MKHGAERAAHRCGDEPHHARPHFLSVKAKRAGATRDPESPCRVPQTALLGAVPDTVAVEDPALRPHKSMVVNGRMVPADPASSDVAAA